MSWYATPAHVVRDIRQQLVGQTLAFDVILCSIREEEFGTNGRDGRHIYSRDYVDRC